MRDPVIGTLRFDTATRLFDQKLARETAPGVSVPFEITEEASDRGTGRRHCSPGVSVEHVPTLQEHLDNRQDVHGFNAVGVPDTDRAIGEPYALGFCDWMLVPRCSLSMQGGDHFVSGRVMDWPAAGFVAGSSSVLNSLLERDRAQIVNGRVTTLWIIERSI